MIWGFAVVGEAPIAIKTWWHSSCMNWLFPTELGCEIVEPSTHGCTRARHPKPSGTGLFLSGPGSCAQALWPGPGGPVPVARSRWPGPGGPVPVARSRWPGPGRGGPAPPFLPWPGGPVPVPVPALPSFLPMVWWSGGPVPVPVPVPARVGRLVAVARSRSRSLPRVPVPIKRITYMQCGQLQAIPSRNMVVLRCSPNHW